MSETDYDADIDYDSVLDYDGIFEALAGFGKYTYVSPFQLTRIQNERKEKIKKQKTDLERLESVLLENERKKQLAAQSAALATKERQVELLAKEQEYLLEINRLLAVRAALVRRIKQNEQFIVALAVMKKRRFRIAV